MKRVSGREMVLLFRGRLSNLWRERPGRAVRCKDYHFLANTHRGRDGSYTFSWDREDRGDLRVKDYWSAHCRMGVWDTGVSPQSAEAPRTIIQKPRGIDECFFIEVQEAMLFPAAEKLQERRTENRNLKRSHRHTQIALWIAAAGLLFAASPQIASLARAVYRFFFDWDC